MFQVFDVKGHSGGECYLLLLEQCNILIDAGLDFSASKTAANIKERLGGKKLDMVLLTHSHYDHASGAAVLKKEYPDAEIVAGEYCAKILQKENARATMRELNAISARRAGMDASNDSIDALCVDRVVRAGDIIKLPGTTIRVLDARGHTNCCISFYFEEEGILAACETHGILFDYPNALPGNIVSYRETVRTIRETKELHPRHVLLAHFGLLPADGIDLYFANAEAVVHEAKDLILADFGKGYTLNEIMEDCKKRYYTKECAVLQPEDAFMLNTRFMVLKTLAEFGLAFSEENA